ncbi:galactosylceramide sulfotransferase-like [Lytechinus variegatus]|uniref:galactosylceramide sulfotransferase-like n=1 Tax=Lytechinus variegatus TaxID=7654 RepID=UPI001BB16CC4|nr:galactosylceramide sulfotransferase-like [Lytechinus variegatus]
MDEKVCRTALGFLTILSVIIILVNKTQKNGIEDYYPATRIYYPIIRQRYLEANASQSTKPRSHCDVIKHVVYIKTHKTGSTTLETLFNRFGFYHNSSFIFNKNGALGHFRTMDLRKADVVKMLLPPLGVKEGDYARYKNYDTSAIHVRFYRDVLDQFMANGTRYVSSVRDPADQWISAYYHFNFRKPISDFAKDRFQMITVNGSLKLPFDKNNSTLDAVNEFLRQPQIYINALKKRGDVIWHFAHNSQTFDLSTDLNLMQRDNETLVNMTLDRLVDELDFVIVNEYFDESLLVMKKAFCWDYIDILYTSQNKRKKKDTLPEETRAKIRAFNRADTLLHQRFNESLWKKIEAYGPDFKKDLDHFRQMLIEVKSECSDKGKIKRDGFHSKILNELAKRDATQFCNIMREDIFGSFGRVFHRQKSDLRSFKDKSTPTKS